MSFPRNTQCAPNPRRTERGSAVITVLLLAAVTAVISAGFLFRSAAESRLATRSMYQSVALNLAEAGIEEALHAVNTTTVNAANGWSLASGSTTDYVKTIASGFNFQQAAGAIHVRIDAALSISPTITAAGVVTFPNQPKLVKQLKVSGVGPAKVWANGIVAKGNVTFSGSADIDSYDSSRGNWNASTNRGDKATVATNATVQLSGAAYIYGYVATGGANPSVGGSGRIYGATSPSTPLVDPSRVRKDFNTNLTDATAPTTTAISLGNYTIGGVTVAALPRLGDPVGANGRYLYTCTNLDVGGSGNLTINGPVDIIVTGNTTIGGAGYIAVGGLLAVNPSLNLYCPGTINIGGSGMVNNTSVPSKSAIWGTKPSTGSAQSISVSGAGAYKGLIYAANGNINLSGSGGVFGAVIGNTVTLSGAAVIHYDVQLGNTVTAGGPTPGAGAGNGYLRIASWAELTDKPGSGDPFARDSRAPFATLF